MQEPKLSPGETFRLALLSVKGPVTRETALYEARRAEQIYLRRAELDLLRETRAFLAKLAPP